MIRRIALAVATVFTSIAISSAVVGAHEGHDHKIMGTVTMAAADHLMLKAQDGKEVTVNVTKDTKARSKPAVRDDEIKSGTRVVITAAQGKDKSFTAKTIQVGATPQP